MKLTTTPPAMTVATITEDHPTYLVEDKGFFIDDILFEDGQVIVLSDEVEPALNLKPLNAKARKKKQELIDKLNSIERGESPITVRYQNVDEELEADKEESISKHVLNMPNKPKEIKILGGNKKDKSVISSSGSAGEIINV